MFTAQEKTEAIAFYVGHKDIRDVKDRVYDPNFKNHVEIIISLYSEIAERNKPANPRLKPGKLVNFKNYPIPKQGYRWSICRLRDCPKCEEAVFEVVWGSIENVVGEYAPAFYKRNKADLTLDNHKCENWTCF